MISGYKKWIFPLWMGLFFVTGCTRPGTPGRTHFTGETQGTYYAVTYYTSGNRNHQPSIDSLLNDFDLTASLWVPHSLINRVNRNEEVVVDSAFLELFRISQEVSEATDGYFDITVGPLVDAWGFGPGGIPSIDQERVEDLLPLVNYRNIRITGGKVIKADPRMKIDFNAVAQGYAVDLIAAFLESKGIENYLVDIGGEVYVHGTKPGDKPWRIGIEKPANDPSSPREIQVEIAVTDLAVATSGDYRKYYEQNGIRYAHTIDPKTGYPVSHSLLSVTVVARRCARADAYSTAFLAMGSEKALQFIEEKRPDLEACFIYSDHKGNVQTYLTDGLKGLVTEIR